MLGDTRHGVSRYAAEVAAASGAPVIGDESATTGPVHLHLNDRLLGATPDSAAARVERLARAVPLTITLHDVPQPTDGPVFAARAAAYGRMVRAARAWATNSDHERALVARWCDATAQGTTIPLPVPAPPAAPAVSLDPSPAIGVFGFVYPGKGHRQVVRAAAALHRAGLPARVLVIGGAAPGHDDEVEDIRRLGAARGVPVEVTGHLEDADVLATLRSVAVPVAAHRNVSASGSLNSWLAAGRRPLVRSLPAVRTIRPMPSGRSSSSIIDFRRLRSGALVILRLTPPPRAVFGISTQ